MPVAAAFCMVFSCVQCALSPSPLSLTFRRDMETCRAWSRTVTTTCQAWSRSCQVWNRTCQDWSQFCQGWNPLCQGWSLSPVCEILISSLTLTTRSPRMPQPFWWPTSGTMSMRCVWWGFFDSCRHTRHMFLKIMKINKLYGNEACYSKFVFAIGKRNEYQAFLLFAEGWWSFLYQKCHGHCLAMCQKTQIGK